MAKLLTIVIPSYNAEDSIHNALNSLDFNLGDFFDVLIVDDGSQKKISHHIKKWLEQYPTIVKCHRKENGNWGSVINYAIRNVKTQYLKILDADDTFNKYQFEEYIKFLKLCSLRNIDITITTYYIKDVKNNKFYGRKYQLTKKIVYTNFDKFFTSKIITMHALTFSIELLKKCKPLLTKMAYTDNLLTYQAILNSKKVALSPRKLYLYVYHCNDANQSMAFDNLLKKWPEILTVFHELIKYLIKIKNNTSKNRMRLLANVVKAIFYLMTLLLALDKSTYKWQRQITFNNELKMIKKIKKFKTQFKQINRGYMFLIKNINYNLIFAINKLVFYFFAYGHIRFIKRQYRKIKINSYS